MWSLWLQSTPKPTHSLVMMHLVAPCNNNGVATSHAEFCTLILNIALRPTPSCTAHVQRQPAHKCARFKKVTPCNSFCPLFHWACPVSHARSLSTAVISRELRWPRVSPYPSNRARDEFECTCVHIGVWYYGEFSQGELSCFPSELLVYSLPFVSAPDPYTVIVGKKGERGGEGRWERVGLPHKG